MPDFDPNNPEYDGEGGGNFVQLKTPGIYLLGIRECILHDRTPKNKKLYSRFAFDVIAGAHRGESFLDSIFRSPSSYKRLAWMCKGIRYTERFDPSSNAVMERVFVGRALKATVEVDTRGYASIKWPSNEWTEAELEAIHAWEDAQKKGRQRQREEFSDGPSDGPSDDLPRAGDEFGDDDIPF
jgi:hypothetical protein